MNGTVNRTFVDSRVRMLLQEGNQDAAASIVIKALLPHVRRYVRSLVRDGDGRDDVLSLWMEDVWRGLPGFRWECSLRVWARQIAWHAVARFMRDGYRRRRVALALRSSTASQLTAPPVPESTPGGRHDQLARFAAELAPEERILIHLRVGRVLAWSEVAAFFVEKGEPISAVALRKRYERIKDRLKTRALRTGVPVTTRT